MMFYDQYLFIPDRSIPPDENLTESRITIPLDTGCHAIADTGFHMSALGPRQIPHDFLFPIKVPSLSKNIALYVDTDR